MPIKVVREYTYKGWNPEDYELIDSGVNRQVIMAHAKKLSQMRKTVVVQRGLGGEIWHVWVKK